MKSKLFKIIIINIIFIILAFMLIEFLVFVYYRSISTKHYDSMYDFTDKVTIHGIDNINNFYSGLSDSAFCGRKPAGLEYNTVPITIFGCSFAYGQYLQYNQTFSYKLSNLLKRPVYNRAIPGGSIQQMYYQVCDDPNQNFYKEVPYSDTIIYVMMSDHYLRTLSYVWFNLFNNHFQPIYTIKKDKPVLKKEYMLKNIFKSTYIFKYLNYCYMQKYIENKKNANKITDLYLSFFINSKKCIEKHHGKKVRFIVLFYEYIIYEDMLREKLKSNGFDVISTRDLIEGGLHRAIYISPENGHPNEKAWDKLVPLLVKKFFD